MNPSFVLFGPPHLWAMTLTVLVPLILVVLARGSEQRARWIGLMFGCILLFNKAVTVWVGASLGLPWREMLPFHLCDAACFTCVWALFTRNRLAYELSYFWGLAGTMQAIVTPDLNFGFPHPRCITFFISHSGIVAAVIYLTGACQLRPTWASLGRAFLGLQVFACVAACVNLVLGTNYGYLCAKPSRQSLMDWMGPWPWYLVALELLAFVSFTIYYLPFVVRDLLVGRLRRS